MIGYREVERWLADNWDCQLTVGDWWLRLAGAGYSHPTWPAGLGGFGATASESRVVLEVLATNRVIAPPTGNVGAALTAPTILAHGTAEQQQALLPPIASGRASWCQLFSEPGSGSDLASVATRAGADRDGWVVTGQKVWSSGADGADFGMLLARTDPDAPKHRGISFLLLDMRQPGVDVRPLRQMDGGATFCEVFITEARVVADAVLGAIGDGWRVAQTTLAAERNAVARRSPPGLFEARSGSRGDLHRSVGQIVSREPADVTQRRGSRALPWKVMADLARQTGAADDPVVRQELARYHTQVRVNGWLMRRIAVAGGRLTGADGSLSKLATARICQQSREVGYRVVGAAGLLSGSESPLSGEVQAVALASPGARIGGGTDEIQLTVAGERALGLPKEPTPDPDVAFRELDVGSQRPG